MCGRYRRKSDKQRIADAFEATAGLDDLDLSPDDDIAPGSVQPVVSINQDGERQLELMRWGFKLPDRLLFNARSEGIETSKFWKDAFLKGRVIIPADAIFEWKEMPKGQKKPKYEFTLTGREPFGMAGVWKLWKNPKTEQWERTFAVITGEPNELMAPIHDRMTTFLESRDYREYLTPAERLPVHLLRILPAQEMCAALVEKSNLTNQQVSLFDSQ
jgi:putative SOS response-associated peptidase YedK